MSNIDRQIVNILTIMHREQLGVRSSDPHCRWYYDGNTDIYHCPHTAVSGGDIIARIPDPYTDSNISPAVEEWDNNPLSHTHPL